MSEIAIVVAMAENRIIGANGKLPWKLPKDLKRFKDLTIGHVVVMGRKTFESIVAAIDGPLPNRKNVILSRTPGYDVPDGCFVFTGLEDALIGLDDQQVFIIGGAEVYRTALKMEIVRTMHVTLVHAQPSGNVCFPEVDGGVWESFGSAVRHEADGDNKYAMTFREYRRKE